MLTVPPKQVQPRGIPTKKKDGINKLLAGVTAVKTKFWHELTTNDTVADLAESTIELSSP